MTNFLANPERWLRTLLYNLSLWQAQLWYSQMMCHQTHMFLNGLHLPVHENEMVAFQSQQLGVISIIIAVVILNVINSIAQQVYSNVLVHMSFIWKKNCMHLWGDIMNNILHTNYQLHQERKPLLLHTVHAV